MKQFKDIFVLLRKELDFNQEEMAKAIGVSKSSIAMWETGQRKPSPELYEQIADYFNVDMDYLYGRSELRKKIHFDNDGNVYIPQKTNRATTINVLGEVTAGIPIDAIQNIVDTEEISEELSITGEFFALKIKGDSMEPKISKGDIVIVRKQDDAESGDVVIVLINGDEATCKRLRKYRDGIELVSTNPGYPPMFFSDEEIISKPVRIIGKVVELRAKF